MSPRFLIALVFVGACASIEESPPVCDGHDGGDGSCVDVGTCAETFMLDAAGRCARWRMLPDLPFASIEGRGVRLPDGRILIAGGDDRSQGGNGIQTARAAIFDPNSEEWREVAPMAFARAHHEMLVTPDGRVFVFGGRGNGVSPSELEIFNPSSDTWSFGTALPGHGLCHGFIDARGRLHIVTGEAYDYVLDESGTWRNADAPLEPRILGALHSLPGGGALLLGGQGKNAQGTYVLVDSAARFDGESDTWIDLGSAPQFIRDFFGSAILADGRVLVVGGQDAFSFLTTVILIDPSSGAVEAATPWPRPFSYGRVVPYEDGALVFGGATLGETDESVLLYTPDEVIAMPILPEPAASVYAFALDDGRVLRTGGSRSPDSASVATSVFERGR